MENTAAHLVPEGRLRLSKSPAAELAAGALRAKAAAELDRAEYIVCAIPAGKGSGALVDRIRSVLADA